MTLRNSTRKIKIGSAFIGGDAPVLVQSMSATKTTDVEATAKTVQTLFEAGCGLVRIAVDHPQDARALAEIRKRTTANLSVDLQENYKMAELVAPFVDKIRYNPGHLHHLEPQLDWRRKVDYLVKVAVDNDCALRIGVNCGSVDPTKRRKSTSKIVELRNAAPLNPIDFNDKNLDASRSENERSDDEAERLSAERFDPLLESALEHSDYLESIGFTRFCVSIKDSDPATVLGANRRFARLRPQFPLHLGVTEAGAPPIGITKTRLALEPLLAEGIGDTLRVSLTVENERKVEEVRAGLLILDNVSRYNIIDASAVELPKLNVVSCPSCSRVQNGAFVALARKIREATEFASDRRLKIAIMGCRVNGPGETDDADIGLWCGPNSVNLKDGETLLGSWPYDQIVERTVRLLRSKIQ